MTQEEFIRKATNIHGAKYDYSKVKYIDKSTKVIITCPIHGDFEQSPESHLKGHNCRKCANLIISKQRSRTPEQFLEEAKNIHPEYNYDKTNYINEQTLVTMTCLKHGDFEIYPNDFLHKGKGCQYCSGKKMNTKSFIEKATLNEYKKLFDYTKVQYVNSKTPITIVCPKHGEFQTTPSNFLREIYGCPKCAKELSYTQFAIQKSKGERIISEWLDKNNIKYIYNESPILIDKLTVYPDFLVNNSVIIEYNGEQHYKYIPFFHKGGEIDFYKQQYRDKKLKEYCLQNNIKLIEIRYDQDIVKELETYKKFLI